MLIKLATLSSIALCAFVGIAAAAQYDFCGGTVNSWEICPGDNEGRFKCGNTTEPDLSNLGYIMPLINGSHPTTEDGTLPYIDYGIPGFDNSTLGEYPGGNGRSLCGNTFQGETFNCLAPTLDMVGHGSLFANWGAYKCYRWRPSLLTVCGKGYYEVDGEKEGQRIGKMFGAWFYCSLTEQPPWEPWKGSKAWPAK